MRLKPVHGVLLIIAATIVWLNDKSWWMEEWRERRAQARNLLNFGGDNLEVAVPLGDLAELDFQSRQQVLGRRLKAIDSLRRIPAFDRLVPRDYKPLEKIFGQIEDGAPWWGLEGLFHYGPGMNGIDGLSEETRFLLNPLALVGVVEARAFITDESLALVATAYPRLQKLSVHHALREIRATYVVRGYQEFLARQERGRRMEFPLSLCTYNARDFGYNVLAVDESRSTGVVFLVSGGAPVRNIQFLHRGGSCGYPGGCNNMSPRQEALEFRVSSLPAQLVVKLGESDGADFPTKADATVVMSLE